jgi:diguanylate cyclase (GGDEF)-like protein
MSVGQPQPHPRTFAFQRPAFTSPRRWSLWALPPNLKYYVIAVDLAAVATVTGTAVLFPVERQDLILFVGLVVGSMLHLEWSRRIERMRELAAEGVSYVSPQAVWSFAGLLLLPPPLVAALIVVLYAHLWFRVSRRIVVHRWVFSASTIVLASACAGAILAALNPADYPGLAKDHLGLAAVIAIVAAAVARWLVNYALVVGAIMLSSPNMPARQALGRLNNQLIEAASLGFGTAVAALMIYQPAVVALLLVPMLTMQRSLLASQLEHVASTDSKTGLLNALYWHELAKKEMERARRLKTSVGVLMIDVDRFKDVNRAHGLVAGDIVLRAVAKTVQSELRGHDLIARLAGEEFIALLPKVDDAELNAFADRICQRIRELEVGVDGEDGPATVRNLTVSVGGSLYPDCADDIDGLLLTADNALFSAKDAGSNSFCVVAPHATA